MQLFLNLVESQNVVALLLIAGIVYAFGKSLVSQQPRSRAWGFRFAFFMLFWYCVATGRELAVFDASTFLPVFLRGLIAATLVLGGSWIVFSAIGPILNKVLRGASSAKWSLSAGRKERLRQAESEQMRLQSEAAELRRREAQLAEDERLAREASQNAASQRQRDDMRYSCELFFNQHATTIADRFTRRDLKLFFKQYMNDEQPPDVVQRRANQLMETIRQHIDAADPPEKMTTLEDIANWYSKQKKEIEKLDTGEMIKEEYLLRLKERYAELTDELLESLKP